MKNTKCRVILTTACNYNCEYCCNKNPEIQDKFKMRTLDQIVESNYEVYNITGGEIGLFPKLLNRVICLIPKDSKIYLHTNGKLATTIHSIFLDRISGINIGYHGHISMYSFFNDLERIRSYGVPIRLQVQDLHKEVFMREVMGRYNPSVYDQVTIKFWKKDVCEKSDEDWIII